MRKGIFLLFALTIFSFCNSQTILNENFNSVSFPPAGWTINSLISSASSVPNYQWKNFNSAFCPGYNCGAFIQASGTNNQNEWLITPTLDLSNNTKHFLQFAYFLDVNKMVYLNDSDFHVKISVDNGNNWSEIFTESELADFFPQSIQLEEYYGVYSIDLSSYSGSGMNNVKVAFHYNNNISNVNSISIFKLLQVKITTEVPFTNFVSANANTIKWFPIKFGTGTYQLEYANSETTPTQGNGTIVNNITNNFYSLPQNHCSYDVYLKYYDNSVYSQTAYSKYQAYNSFNITTPTFSTCDILWRADAQTYTLEYGLNGFTQGSGTIINISGDQNSSLTGYYSGAPNYTFEFPPNTWSNPLTQPNHNYEIEILQSCTTYDYYITNSCNGVLNSSTTSFKTSSPNHTVNIIPPFIETFNDDLCSIGYLSSLTENNIISQSFAGVSGNVPVVDSNSIGTVKSGSTANNQLEIFSIDGNSGFTFVTSRGITLNQGEGVAVKFKVKKHPNSINDPNLLCKYESPLNGFNIDNFYTITNFNFIEYSFNFIPDYSDTYSFTFEVTGADSGVLIDDFEITTCKQPSISNFTINSTSFNFNWDNSSNITIEYNQAPFDLGNGITVNNISGNNYSITGLNPCTDYKMFYKSNCNTLSSEWDTFYFTTPSTNYSPLSIPYLQPFNQNFCDIYWSCNNTNGSISDNLTISSVEPSNNPTLINTPYYSFSNSLPYYLSYNLLSYSNSLNLKVYLQEQSNNFNNSILIKDYSNTVFTNTTTYENDEITLNIPSTGNYRIYFESINGSYSIDDFSISNSSLSNANFKLNDFIIFPNPANQYFIIQNKNSESEPFKYKISDNIGRVVQTGNSKFNELINIESLTSGNYFIQIQTTQGNQTFKIIKE